VEANNLEPGSTDLASIYKLIDPIPSDVVYVGRTIQPLELRRRAHIHNGYQSPVYRWVCSLVRAGREPVIIEIEQVPVEQAVAAEDRWIAHYRAGGATVLNVRSGTSGSFSREIHQQRYHNIGGHNYRGVTRSGKTRWRAYMRHKGVYQNLGTYATVEEAARAYDQAAIALFGAAALLNFPDEFSPSILTKP
jgi:hypothetical protein